MPSGASTCDPGRAPRRRRRPRYWHISGWPAVLLTPILLPVAVVVQLLPFKRTEDRPPEEVALYIREFLDGSGGDWDWDDFTSVPISDPWLDAIRDEADMVGLPVDQAGRATLETLLRRVEAGPGA